MKKSPANRKQKRPDLAPLIEPFLVDDTPVPWDDPEIRFVHLPSLLRKGAELQDRFQEAVQRFFREAPPQAIEQFEPVYQRVRQRGGWDYNTPEENAWQASLNLYHIYKGEGEEAILTDLADWWKHAEPFFSTQWWVINLLQEWRRQGDKGKRKIKQLKKRGRGKWESPLEKESREKRNRLIVPRIYEELEKERTKQIAKLQDQYQQVCEKQADFNQKIERQRQKGDVICPTSQDKRIQRLNNESAHLLKTIRDLKAGGNEGIIRAALSKVTTNQQEFGCYDNLTFSAIRKIYYQAEEKARARRNARGMR